MEIQYLKQLKDNPYHFSNPDLNNEPIPESEILHLEQLYNQGKTFPKALRELLYLAGNFCYLLDYGINESQEELQEFVREELKEEEKEIARLYFVIDVYNAGTQFLFVYLDEGENSAVYEGYYRKGKNARLINESLLGFIDSIIEDVKQGFGPF